ncbi:expressed unknown protein [Seminavis robusta]|uniref:Uncharacterized protein n=1 Tax=Seminavis robusta TaxID=568900 RepID=A0A9N8HIG4_9STRA|nr:expressed unknown protein [Seminavis robusta]|eukprot:Sro696_g188840.1 n/a (300) ;mRNA; f:10989-12082
MISSIARAFRARPAVKTIATRALFEHHAPPRILAPRFFSTTNPQSFQPTVPAEITRDVAESIQDTTLFYLRHGISNQRLLSLSNDTESPLVHKWQRMMEIYLSTQVFVISGLGYPGDERGLETYTRHLAEFMQHKCDDEERDSYKKVGQETWQELLATAFDLDTDNIQTLSIVDARNIMHKVSSKMQEPDVLMKIQKECAKLPHNPDIELELTQKHMVLQTIIVNDVYMGGSPSLVESCGFGSGEKGYAYLQCVMAEFESDPLIAQYAGAAMARIWEAAGLDMNSIQNAGNIRVPGGTP